MTLFKEQVSTGGLITKIQGGKFMQKLLHELASLDSGD